MIRKLIIIDILAAVAYGVFRWMDDQNFWGARDKKRQTLEDFEKKASD